MGRAHLCWRVCACLNCCHVCMEFHACRPTRLSCHDSTYDRICTIRLGRERAPSEDIKLLAFILHLHWTLCLIDCLKEKERGKNPWMWKEVKIPRPKLWKRQLRGAGVGGHVHSGNFGASWRALSGWISAKKPESRGSNLSIGCSEENSALPGCRMLSSLPFGR